MPCQPAYLLGVLKFILRPLCRFNILLPHHKNGSRDYNENYRPIAKLRTLPKVFGHLVTKQLIRSIKSIISPHRLVLRRASVTTPSELLHHVLNALKTSRQSELFFAYFSKLIKQIKQMFRLQIIFQGLHPRFGVGHLRGQTQKAIINSHNTTDINCGSGICLVTKQ